MRSAGSSVEYLASCSQSSLESMELARLAQVSNLRKEVDQVLSQLIESEVDARLARVIRERRLAQAAQRIQPGLASRSGKTSPVPRGALRLVRPELPSIPLEPALNDEAARHPMQRKHTVREDSRPRSLTEVPWTPIPESHLFARPGMLRAHAGACSSRRAHGLVALRGVRARRPGRIVAIRRLDANGPRANPSGPIRFLANSTGGPLLAQVLGRTFDHRRICAAAC